MTDPTLEPLLKEIRDLLVAQQQLLQGLRSAPASASPGKSHLRLLIILSVIILAIGGVGAYGYYRILQSIIDQFPV